MSHIAVKTRDVLRLVDAGYDLAIAFITLAARGTASEEDRRHAKKLASKFTEAAEKFPDPYACRGCGCTEDRACDGGCWWVESPAPGKQGLCSSCVRDASPDNAGAAPAAPLNRKTTRRRK